MSIPRATFFVTHRCNLVCDYCLTILPEQATPDLSTEDTLRVVDAICALDPEVVILTGGEPTSRRDLQAIVDRFGFHQQPFVIITNGTRPGILDMPGVENISCSVDVNARFRRRVDAPDDETWKAATGAQLLIKAVQRGMEGTASVVAHRDNAELLPGLVRDLADFGVRSFVSVIHGGDDQPWRFRGKDASRLLTLEQAEKLSVELCRIYDEEPDCILNDRGYLEAIARHGATLDWHCGPASDLVVDTDGSILTCSDWWGERCKNLNVLDPAFSLNTWRLDFVQDASKCPGCFWQCVWQAESGESSL